MLLHINQDIAFLISATPTKKEVPFCIMFKAQKMKKGQPVLSLQMTVSDYYYGVADGKRLVATGTTCMIIEFGGLMTTWPCLSLTLTPGSHTSSIVMSSQDYGLQAAFCHSNLGSCSLLP